MAEQTLDLHAYTLKDKNFGTLKVQKSANAWWLDRGKLNNLITALKYGSTIKEASFSAGISVDQYKYFIECHPNFSTIVEACRQMPVLIARKTIVERLDKDPKLAKWYLEKKRSEEFGRNAEEVASGLRAAEMRAEMLAEYRPKP